jgi:hypothetical protein
MITSSSLVVLRETSLYITRTFQILLHVRVGRKSIASIATRYGLNGLGIESHVGGEIFRARQDRPWGPPSLLYNGYRVFPGGKTAGVCR